MLSSLKPSNWKPLDVLTAFLALALVVVALDINVFNLAMAAESDPFKKATDKGNSLAEMLTGNLAAVVTGLVIIITGFLMLTSRISHLVGVRILLGAVVIGSAMSIAQWMFT